MTPPAAAPGGGRTDLVREDVRVTLEELRERNPNAVFVDGLYLLTTAFFAHLFVRGLWPAVIAAVPLSALLFFGFRSSRAFFATQVVVIVAAVALTEAGLVPL